MKSLSAIQVSFLFLLLWSVSNAHQIEFYADWAPKAKGTALFTQKEEWEGEEWPTLWKIQAKLQERGWKIKSWDLEFYRPILLKGKYDDWNQWVHSNKNDPNGLWVFWNMGGWLKGCDFSRVPKEKLVLFMWEPPTVQPSLYDPNVQALFGKIFTWDDDLVDNQKFFKFHYPVLKNRIETIPTFDQKKLCVMINSCLSSRHPKQLYEEREIAIRFFENKEGEFDLFGPRWDQKGYKNWKGKAVNKALTLSKYRFCICYENTCNVKGYVTEKIFDCFMAGCVPIYWGASNICDYVPADCFIDRRQFKDMEELYFFLKRMGRKEYERYLDRAAAFLQSKKAKVFSRDAFVQLFVEKLVH